LVLFIPIHTVKAFLEEVRTQHIYRIAAGYMVSSWLILQITSLLCSALGLPNWTLKAILALLLVGFGAALIIGWRIDLRGAPEVRFAWHAAAWMTGRHFREIGKSIFKEISRNRVWAGEKLRSSIFMPPVTPGLGMHAGRPKNKL
jgi:hypothetical protein